MAGIITVPENASTPSTPATGYWSAYAKSDGLYILDDAGTETGPLGTGGGGGGGLTPSTGDYAYINLIKNYPSLEGADGAAPGWWSSSNCTLTEEDATGASIPQIYERVLKGVTSATNGYFYQTYTFADEPSLDASVTVVSAGCWVYVVSAGTLTVNLYDDGGAASLGTATTTTTGSWVYLSIENKTLGTTSVTLRFGHSANSATFYVAMPTLHVSTVAQPFAPRPVRHVGKGTSDIIAGDPGGTTAGWQNYDASSVTSNLTCMVNLQCLYRNTSAAGSGIAVRRNGLSAGPVNYQFMVYVNSTSTVFTIGVYPDLLVDSSQVFQYYSSAAAANSEALYMAISGYKEWA